MEDLSIRNEIELRMNPSDFSITSSDLIDIMNEFGLAEEEVVLIYNEIVDEKRREIQSTTDEVLDYFREKGHYYPTYQEFKKEFQNFDDSMIDDSVLRDMYKQNLHDKNQLSLFEIIKEEIAKVMSEYGDEDEDELGMFSGDFDEDEFDNAAMMAAKADIGDEFVPLGKSKFEKNLDPNEFKADLKRQNLNLPKDREELSNIDRMMTKRKEQEKLFGKGSLNENLLQVKDSEGNDLKRNMLVKPVAGVDKKGRIIGFGDDGAGRLQIIVNWAWPIDMKFTNPEEMGTVRIYPEDVVVANSKKMDESESSEEIPSNLRGVKVTYADGSVIPTSMAAHLSDEEIYDYFKKGKMFNIGNGENDNLQAVEKVEIIRENEDELPHSDHPDGFTFDTTNLYKWFKDAFYQLSSYDEAAAAEIMEKAFRRDFTGKFNINEWDGDEGPQPGDIEYHTEKPERFSGLSNFKDIDWVDIHPVLVNNTKILKYKEPIDSITYSVNNFEEIGVSKEDLNLLEDHDIIYIWNGNPIIDDEQYLDFNNFLQAAQSAWEKGFSNMINEKNMKTENKKEEEINELEECGMEMESKESEENEDELDEARGLGKGVKNSGDRNVKLRDDHKSAPLTNLNESVDKNIKKLFEGTVTKKQLREFISEQAKKVAKSLKG